MEVGIIMANTAMNSHPGRTTTPIQKAAIAATRKPEPAGRGDRAGAATLAPGHHEQADRKQAQHRRAVGDRGPHLGRLWHCPRDTPGPARGHPAWFRLRSRRPWQRCRPGHAPPRGPLLGWARRPRSGFAARCCDRTHRTRSRRRAPSTMPERAPDEDGPSRSGSRDRPSIRRRMRIAQRHSRGSSRGPARSRPTRRPVPH